MILAPFGLEGTLTGREWSDAEPATARLLEAWRLLYPLEHGCGAVEVSAAGRRRGCCAGGRYMAGLLQVVCGGARMRYPVPYVLGTRMEAAGPPEPAPRMAHRALASLTTPAPHQVHTLYLTPLMYDSLKLDIFPCHHFVYMIINLIYSYH